MYKKGCAALEERKMINSTVYRVLVKSEILIIFSYNSILRVSIGDVIFTFASVIWVVYTWMFCCNYNVLCELMWNKLLYKTLKHIRSGSICIRKYMAALVERKLLNNILNSVLVKEIFKRLSFIPHRSFFYLCKRDFVLNFRMEFNLFVYW